MNIILDKYRNYIKYILFINILLICTYKFLYNETNYIHINNENLILSNGLFVSFLEIILLKSNDYIINIISIYIVPILIALLLFKIFNKYISVFWSSIFTFVGIFSNETYPFRSYLINLDKNIEKINFEIFSFPLPSLIYLFFLFMFFISVNNHKFSHLKVSIYTFLWIILAELSLINGFLGILFWISYFPFKIITDKNNKKNIYKYCIYILILIIYLFFKFYNLERYNVNINYNDQIYYLFYHLIAYLFLPIFFIIISLLYIKVDLYEFLIKFSNIIILILADHLLLIIFIFFGYSLAKIDSNIQMIFAHFYFFVPCVYFLDRSILSFYGVSEKNNFLYYLKNFIYFSFNYILVIMAIIFYVIYNFYLFEFI